MATELSSVHLDHKGYRLSCPSLIFPLLPARKRHSGLLRIRCLLKLECIPTAHEAPIPNYLAWDTHKLQEQPPRPVEVGRDE
jgi:hypothetical protein